MYAQGIFYVNIKKKKKKENCERKPVLTEHCIMHTTGDKKWEETEREEEREGKTEPRVPSREEVSRYIVDDILEN